jgi:hypothetical protein
MKRTQPKKQVERGYAESAARKLGEAWTFGEGDRENPDFLVSCAWALFGLEVTECYIGETTKAGSRMRRAEAANDEWLFAIRAEFEAFNRTPLRVRYHGEATPEAQAEILRALRSAHFESNARFADIRCPIGHGWLHAFKSNASSWTFANNRGGSFCRDGNVLQSRIDHKSAKLPEYRLACEEVRLLLVSPQPYNSGKLELPDDFRPDVRGFDAVYFFAYPVSVTQFYAAVRG